MVIFCLSRAPHPPSANAISSKTKLTSVLTRTTTLTWVSRERRYPENFEKADDVSDWIKEMELTNKGLADLE
jgi:hypothetical protein